jgi:hypothetical protein
MCICCLVVDPRDGARFPFVLLSVRDEMLTRATADMRTHPVSGTSCCVDESLPEDQRGSWLAVNAQLGTFAILTNSSEPTRAEPTAATPSRGLLVMNAVEARGGRLSEAVLARAVPSWTARAPGAGAAAAADGDAAAAAAAAASAAPPANPLCTREAVAALKGFNLWSGSLVPGAIDVRLTTNVYSRAFDEPLVRADGSGGGSEVRGWAMSNTFMDNAREPRLALLRERALAAHAGAATVTELVDALGAVALLRPEIADEALPEEALNLPAVRTAAEVQLERQCQRNISSYAQWYELRAGAAGAVKLDWGTRSHTIVVVERDVVGGASRVHTFHRKVAVLVDAASEAAAAQVAAAAGDGAFPFVQVAHSFQPGAWAAEVRAL